MTKRVGPKKKIGLLLCSSISGIRDQASLDHWLEQMPEVGILADIKPIFVFGKNSAAITPTVWLELTQHIAKHSKTLHGFVVLHGTDAIEYTGAALSFLIQGNSFPVVFSGSDSLNDDAQKQGLKSNLINAVQVATLSFGEIGIMFGNRLLRANQVFRSRDQSLNIFTASNDAVLGKVDFSIRLFEKNLISKKAKLKISQSIESNIVTAHLDPLVTTAKLQQLSANSAGVVLDAGDYHSLPAEVERFVRSTNERLPIVIWSKHIQAGTLSPKNIIVVNDMTWATTITKFMWLLSATKGIKQIRDGMHRDVARETISKL